MDSKASLHFLFEHQLTKIKTLMETGRFHIPTRALDEFKRKQARRLGDEPELVVAGKVYFVFHDQKNQSVRTDVRIHQTGEYFTSFQLEFADWQLPALIRRNLSKKQLDLVMERKYKELKDLPKLKFYREDIDEFREQYHIVIDPKPPSYDRAVQNEIATRSEQEVEISLLNMSDEEFEIWLNSLPDRGNNKIKYGYRKLREYSTKTIQELKTIYGYRCQICEAQSITEYNIDTSEAHHIIPFSISADNSPSNIIILCPFHHRLLHKLDWVFDFENLLFRCGVHNLPIKLTKHFLFSKAGALAKKTIDR